MFFHNFSGHWALSHVKEGIIYLYDSLQQKSLHPDLREQMQCLYSEKLVRIRPVQQQKGSIDCGCFSLAFCTSILFGDDPARLIYDQAEMRNHIIQCFTNKNLTPFPAVQRKSRHGLTSMDIII
jgi:hypothetical protein